MTKRRMASWVAGFTKFTDQLGAPLLWRRWAALSAVSGALERRCVLATSKGQLVPNLFVLLVSPPGIGKTVVINVVRDFWGRVPGLHVAPSSTTRAGLIDFMVDCRAVDTSRPLPVIYHSVLFASAEFGNLVPIYDNAWLNCLNDIYDCGKIFSDMTRYKGKVEIEHPHMVMLAGTQPKYLDGLLPEAAFGMGFTSRLMMVYAGDSQYVSLFEHIRRSGMLEEYLTEDLQTIAKLRGEFFLTPEAVEYWEGLAKSKFSPTPTHSKLQHYNARRASHLLKMAMCFSAAESNTLRVSPEHLEKSLILLHETEHSMPEIFEVMAVKGYAAANEEALHYVLRAWQTNGRKAMQETQLIRFLSGKVPNNQIRATIELLVQSGQLRMKLVTPDGGIPYKTYTPAR